MFGLGLGLELIISLRLVLGIQLDFGYAYQCFHEFWRTIVIDGKVDQYLVRQRDRLTD